MVAQAAEESAGWKPATTTTVAGDCPPPPPPPPRSEYSTSAAAAERRARRANRGGIRRLVASTARLADLQYRIWLTEAKITVAHIALYAALFGAAGVVGLLGIIFLYIGLFHLLTDVAGLAPVWSYLIFAVVQLGMAAVLVFVARSILSKPADKG